MSYWVIKDKDDDYLLPPDVDGYAYCGSIHYAARFETEEEALLQLKECLEGDNCAYNNSDYYSYEVRLESKTATPPPTPNLEDRVAALEASVSQLTTFPTALLPSVAQDTTITFTLAELKNSVDWYCDGEDATLPMNENNGDLWLLWERAFWNGVEWAKEEMVRKVADIELP